MPTRQKRSSWLLLAVLPLTATAACADATNGNDESWEPTEEVELTVPFGAGGGTDVMARTIAEGLESVRPELTIAVANREGGSGAQGYTHSYQQQDDPHQLLAVESTVVSVPMLTDVPFHWSDFTPIGQVSDHVTMIAAQDGAYEGFEGLLDAAQEEALSMSVSGGPLGLQAMTAAFITIATDAEFQEPNFGTGSEAINRLVAGDVDAAIASPEHATEFLRSGDLQGMAVMTEERIPFGVLQDVPTAQEQGVDTVFTGVRGLFAAPEISEAEREYWVGAFEDWLESDAYDEYIESTQSVSNPAGPEEFTANIEEFEELAQQAAETMG